MSDSSKVNQPAEKKDEFDSRAHLEGLCEGGRISINNFISIEYKRGWIEIIEEMVRAIKRYPIGINQICTEYGQLDIMFNCFERTHEVRVWRALDIAKRKSLNTCMECGEAGLRQIRREKVVVLCRRCIKRAEENGETGTWLDKY